MCTFCQIVAGETSAHVVHDEELFLAFLDIRPVFPGHTLLIPKQHHETISDLPVDLIDPFFRLAQRLAGAVPAALDSVGTFMAINNIVSQSVPHLHMHVVPRRPKDGLRGFFWPRTKYRGGDEEMARVAERIGARLLEP